MRRKSRAERGRCYKAAVTGSSLAMPVSEPSFERVTTKELLWLAPLYATFSFVQLKLKLAVTSTWTSGHLVKNHHRLLDFDYTNNEQSRILQFYLPEALHQLLRVSVPNAYLIQRGLFVFAAFMVMHAYCRGWFDRAGAALCVSIQAAVMALSHMNDLQESAPLLGVLFIACLWAIREHRDLGYAIALLLGAMTNETILVLAAVHFFFNVEALPRTGADALRVLKVALRTTALTLPAFGYTLLIRYVTRDNPHLGGAWHWPDNIHGLGHALTTSPLTWHRRQYTYLWLLYGPLWIYAYVSWRQKPVFLRAASLMVPIFIAAHLLTGIISEVRQMLPLGAVIIPMALWSFLRPSQAMAR